MKIVYENEYRKKILTASWIVKKYFNDACFEHAMN